MMQLQLMCLTNTNLEKTYEYEKCNWFSLKSPFVVITLDKWQTGHIILPRCAQTKRKTATRHLYDLTRSYDAKQNDVNQNPHLSANVRVQIRTISREMANATLPTPQTDLRHTIILHHLMKFPDD